MTSLFDTGASDVHPDVEINFTSEINKIYIFYNLIANLNAREF